jgi:hypothetical protein
MLNHVVFIPHDADYEDEIADALEATQALLADALDDVDRMPAFDASQLFIDQDVETDDDDDDEEVSS